MRQIEMAFEGEKMQMDRASSMLDMETKRAEAMTDMQSQRMEAATQEAERNFRLMEMAHERRQWEHDERMAQIQERNAQNTSQ